MGCYDEVAVPCPKCQTRVYFQSKGGACSMQRFELAQVPPEVLANVNRHAPVVCEVCGTSFAVDETTRTAVAVEPWPEEARNINAWYDREGPR